MDDQTLTFVQILLVIGFCVIFLGALFSAAIGTWKLFVFLTQNERLSTIITIPFGLLYIAIGTWLIQKLPDNLISMEISMSHL